MRFYISVFCLSVAVVAVTMWAQEPADGDFEVPIRDGFGTLRVDTAHDAYPDNDEVVYCSVPQSDPFTLWPSYTRTACSPDALPCPEGVLLTTAGMGEYLCRDGVWDWGGR